MSLSCVRLFATHGLYSPWNSPGQNTGVGSLSFLQGIFPTQGSNPGLPHSRRIFLPAEPQGKSKNTSVGSLSLLQRIFPTQESNWGLLHCRHIRYQLSYQYTITLNMENRCSVQPWPSAQFRAFLLLSKSCSFASH